MDQIGLIIQKRCKDLLKQQGGKLALNKLYENYVRLYGNSYLHNSTALMLWLQEDDSSFLFDTVDYYYCILGEYGISNSGSFIIEKAKELLRGHSGKYSSDVLFQKMKNNKYVTPSMTEETLLSYLKKDSQIIIEKRSYILCRLNKTNLEQSRERVQKQTNPSTYSESSGVLSLNKKREENSHHIVASTLLSKLYKDGLLSKKELEHCWRKDLKTVGDVVVMIDRYQLTKESTRFTQYTLDIWFKIFDLWSRPYKSSETLSNVNQQPNPSLSKATGIYPAYLSIESKSFIKEYYSEHNKRPFWFELYHATQYVQSKSHHLTIEKVIQRTNNQYNDDNVKNLLKAVRQDYQLHKDFYFPDEQPLSSWRTEQLDEEITESGFLHFAASVYGYEIVTLDNDEVMIKTSLADVVKPIEKEIKRCINLNEGTNTLILIDELLPIDIEPEQEKGLKQFASIWLNRHYKIEVSGDSFWI